MTVNQKLLIKEFFLSMTSAMPYEWSDRSRELAHRVLRLLNAIFKEDVFEECCDLAEATACLQKAEDILLVNAMKDGYSEDTRVALDVKAEILSRQNIKNLKSFDLDMLSAEVEESALSGEIHGCKLWAYMNWEGIGTEPDRRTALQLWEMLAINGDLSSMRALEYAHSLMGNAESAKTWRTARELCVLQGKMTEPMPIQSRFETDRRACELAEIIACIRSRARKKNGGTIDRCMSQYALYSKDPLGIKLQTLSTEDNFYMILFNERASIQKTTIGF